MTIEPDGDPVFCERWDEGEHRPGGVICEVEARRRDGLGQPYMVVFSDEMGPQALIEVNWSLDSVGVWFLDKKMRRYLKYAFTRVDPETLFMGQMIHWEYPLDAVRDLSTATKVTYFGYNQAGSGSERIEDLAAGTSEVVSRPRVSLNINWELVPEFGDWTRLRTWDRVNLVTSWYVGVFEKTGNQYMVKRLPTVGIDNYFVRKVWSLPEDDGVIGGCYDITSEYVDQVQDHVAEKIDLDAYYYELCNERAWPAGLDPMNGRSWDWAVGALRGVAIDCEGLLSERDVANVREFIDVGEPGLALETLSTQLDEYEAEVPVEVRARLSELRVYFGIG